MDSGGEADRSAGEAGRWTGDCVPLVGADLVVATNPKLKEALLKKLNVTPQRLSQLVKARKEELPMSTELAVYTIAHENRLDITKFLPDDQTREVRQLVAELRAGRNGRTETDSAPTRSKQSKGRPRPAVITIAGIKIGDIPVLKASHAKEAKAMAERERAPTGDRTHEPA